MLRQEEVPFGGVYRLRINGQLVGEFVPGNHWTQIYNDAQERYGAKNVKSSWEAFDGRPLYRKLTPQSYALNSKDHPLEQLEAIHKLLDEDNFVFVRTDEQLVEILGLTGKAMELVCEFDAFDGSVTLREVRAL